MRRLTPLLLLLVLLVTALAAVPMAMALRSAVRRPSVAAPQAGLIGARGATLTAVVDTAGLGGSLSVAYGRTSALTTRIALRTIAHGTAAGRTGGPIRGLAPGTVYHYRVSLRTDEGTVVTPDATLRTLRVRRPRR